MVLSRPIVAVQYDNDSPEARLATSTKIPPEGAIPWSWIRGKLPAGSPKCATTPSSAVRSRLLREEDVEQALAIMKRRRLEACKSISEIDKATPRGKIEHA